MDFQQALSRLADWDQSQIQLGPVHFAKITKEQKLWWLNRLHFVGAGNHLLWVTSLSLGPVLIYSHWSKQIPLHCILLCLYFWLLYISLTCSQLLLWKDCKKVVIIKALENYISCNRPHFLLLFYGCFAALQVIRFSLSNDIFLTWFLHLRSLFVLLFSLPMYVFVFFVHKMPLNACVCLSDLFPEKTYFPSRPCQAVSGRTQFTAGGNYCHLLT